MGYWIYLCLLFVYCVVSIGAQIQTNRRPIAERAFIVHNATTAKRVLLLWLLLVPLLTHFVVVTGLWDALMIYVGNAPLGVNKVYKEYLVFAQKAKDAPQLIKEFPRVAWHGLWLYVGSVAASIAMPVYIGLRLLDYRTSGRKALVGESLKQLPGKGTE